MLALAAVALVGSNAEMIVPRDGAAHICPAAVARAFAPVLWFSPDEPLLSGAEPPPIPSAVPGEAADTAIVYYQVRPPAAPRTRQTESPTGGCPEPLLDLRPDDRLSIRYFFYYPRDLGTNPHAHDIEGARLDLLVSESTPELVRLRLDHVRAFAHGLSWLDNRLDVAQLRRSTPGGDSRVELPLTLLVEEGKHASLPDRNGDGVYTPGYDVNVHLREAWGIRDTFGSGVLVPRFSAELVKPRANGRRVRPPPLDPEHRCGDAAETHYALRPATVARPAVLASAAYAADKKFRGMIGANHFGAPEKGDGVLHWMGENLSIVARRDAGWGLALLGKLAHMPLVDGWLVGRLSKKGSDPRREWGFELVYSPSASGWISPYFAGAGYAIPPEGEAWAWRNFEWRPEIGVKLRIARDELPEPLKTLLRIVFPIHKLARFAGIRVGLRAEPLDDLLGTDGPATRNRLRGVRGVRLVWEMGGGAW